MPNIVTRRQVAAILARHGYKHNPRSTVTPEETQMLKNLGSRPDDWIAAFINDTEVCFSTLPFGKLHLVSHDVLLNRRPARTDPDRLEMEIMAAEALVREARWAILTHMGRVEVEPVPQEAEACPVRHRNGATKR
jgi:hypothetical protein